MQTTTTNSKIDSSDAYKKTAPNQDFNKRRRLEIKRRQGLLTYRRERLERELHAIEICLTSLDKQLQKEHTYEQLSIYKT
ncbi:lactate dehydrogenase [Prochlorococcus sp. MIT 1300]|uniref:lactate dehydrogenase n=1 Tax=Prochlorococcus sp. MIT 1300 TaxID=3096218 RepID=UPI002A752EE2|nr:lactate dehydrogenase [Prochlorococcus sp. MIT 1300]